MYGRNEKEVETTGLGFGLGDLGFRVRGNSWPLWRQELDDQLPYSIYLVFEGLT